MATKNSINNISNPLSSSAITVDPGASGDSYIDFDINTTQEFRMGVDDTDSDSFKLAPSALGTGDLWKITSGGNVTHPLSSAVLAQNSSQNNVTGDGTDYTMPFVTELIDQNGNFSSPTFTAPITGIYYFCGYLNTRYSNSTSTIVDLVTTARTYSCAYQSPLKARDVSLAVAGRFNFLADMTASDTATFHITNSGGTKITDVTSGTISVVNK